MASSQTRSSMRLWAKALQTKPAKSMVSTCRREATTLRALCMARHYFVIDIEWWCVISMQHSTEVPASVAPWASETCLLRASTMQISCCSRS